MDRMSAKSEATSTGCSTGIKTPNSSRTIHDRDHPDGRWLTEKRPFHARVLTGNQSVTIAGLLSWKAKRPDIFTGCARLSTYNRTYPTWALIPENHSKLKLRLFRNSVKRGDSLLSIRSISASTSSEVVFLLEKSMVETELRRVRRFSSVEFSISFRRCTIKRKRGSSQSGTLFAVWQLCLMMNRLNHSEFEFSEPA